MLQLRLKTFISDAVVFLSFFLSIWLWVDPSINYYYPGFWRNNPLDGYTTWFLTDTPFYPGKPCYWLLSLLAPGFAGALGGAFILTAIALVLTLLCKRLLRALGVKHGLGWKYIPALILFLQFVHMVNTVPSAISTIIGLTFAWLYQGAGGLKPGNRLALFALFSTFVIIGAAEVFMVFALLCIIFELMVRRSLPIALIQTAVGACLPAAITVILFPLCTSAETYRLMLPSLTPVFSFTDVLLSLVFWIYVPGMAVIALADRHVGHLRDLRSRQTSRSALHGMVRGILPGVLAVLATGTALLLIHVIHDPLAQARPHAVMNSAMLTRNWDLLLDEAKRTPKRYLTGLKVHIIDRALYHKGRLLDDFFRFPQSQSTLLPFPYSSSDTKSLNPGDRFWTAVWGSWTYYELGLVNTAEHCALEAASQFYYPEGYKLLSLIYFTKEMPDAGRTCLNALRKDPVYRSWAETGLTSLESDPEVKAIGSYLLKKEYMNTDISPLTALVEKNPNNKMAFEYLIASLLGQRKIDSLDRYVEGLRALNYERIPKLFEEALLLHASITKKEPDLRGYSISGEAIASFNEFFTILDLQYGGRIRDAYRDLIGRFGDSYFFYYVYGFSKAMAPDEKS
jgi:hypothetical protein